MKRGKYERSEEAQPKEKVPPIKTAAAYLHDLSYLLATVILVFLLLFRIAVVDGNSMYDTLVDGDYLLLLGNLFYQDPKAGDVIVASKQSFADGAPIVKRIIATEGQTVDIDFNEGIVYVDGVALDEPYTKTLTTLREGSDFPQVVEEGNVFVMGDNRNNSKDSRSTQIGQVDKREVLGKVIFLMYPGTGMKGDQARDFDRIGAIA